MADIKFMNLSENDNPAATDSILIGNEDNGLKRTTLYKLSGMFAIHGLFHFEEVKQAFKANTNNYSLQAPNIEGYKFVFWLAPYTYGKSHSFYVSTPLSSTTSVFTSEQITVDDTVGDQWFPNPGVGAIAVYVKENVA